MITNDTLRTTEYHELVREIESLRAAIHHERSSRVSCLAWAIVRTMAGPEGAKFLQTEENQQLLKSAYAALRCELDQ